MPQSELYWKGRRVSWDIEELSEVLRDEFEKNSYTVVGDPNALFDDESAWKAEYLIGALLGEYYRSKRAIFISVGVNVIFSTNCEIIFWISSRLAVSHISLNCLRLLNMT